MSLNIECGTFHSECLNHPNDVYIYFDGGFLVWNCNTSESLGIWFNGDMFMLAKRKYKTGNEACIAINQWASEMLAAS